MKKTAIAFIVTLACLVAGGGVAIILLLRERAEIKSLRTQLTARQTEIESLQAQLVTWPTNRVNLRAPSPEVIPPATDANGFVGVAESAIPGRYKRTQSEQEKGIVTLFPDHTFESHKGEKFAAYRWQLSRDRLVLEWNIGSIHYTSVESPGVYVGARTDGQTERMEKVE